MAITEEAAKALRAPFEPSQVGKLPRKGTAGLDYVGHAAVTDRLLSVDPEWSWEPVAFAEDGAPLISRRGDDAVLWVRLTVCGVTRLGVGIARADAFELEKQLISDALRNGAMRFGVALDLWSKQDLHDVAAEPQPPLPEGFASVEEFRAARDALAERVSRLDTDARPAFDAWKADQGFPVPWPRAAIEAMDAELDRLVQAATDALAEAGEEPF